MFKRIFEKEKKAIIFAAVGVSLIIIALVVGLNLEKTDNTKKVYAEYKDKIQGWLVKNVQNSDSYIINLSIYSYYEAYGENGVTRKDSTRKYKITASRIDRTAKIELNGGDVVNPKFAKVAFGDKLNKAIYLDTKNNALSIYLPQGDGYKKYECKNEELKRAVEAILFPDNINIPIDSIIASGESYANNEKAFEDIQINIDSAPFYEPFYAFTGEQKKEQNPLYISLSYSNKNKRLSTIRVIENGSRTLGLVHMAYKTITGEEYSKTYEGMYLRDESMDVGIVPDSNQTKIELPYVKQG